MNVSDQCLEGLEFEKDSQLPEQTETSVKIESMLSQADISYRHAELATIAVEIPSHGFFQVVEGTYVPANTNVLRSPTTGTITGLSPVVGG